MSKINIKELEDARTRILKWIPTSEHKVAEQIIYRAIKLGFIELGLWPPLDPSESPTVKDITGVKDGTIYFLYGKI